MESNSKVIYYHHSIDRNLKVHFPDKSTKDEQILEDLKNQKKNDENYFNEKELLHLLKDKSLKDSIPLLRKS